MLTGLNCGHCGSENVYIKDSRPDKKRDCVIRRRICEDCGDRFTTFEVRRTEELIEFLRSQNDSH